MGNLRIELSKEQFDSISLYKDNEYLMFNYEELLMHPIMDNMFPMSEAKRIYKLMTNGQKALFDTATIIAKSYGGGIHEYFYSYFGFYSGAIKSLKLIGDSEMINMFKKARIKFIKSFLPWNRIILLKRNSKNCDYESESYDWFDDWFYKHAPKMQQLMIDYMKLNYFEYIK